MLTVPRKLNTTTNNSIEQGTIIINKILFLSILFYIIHRSLASIITWVGC
jgi:hypothetical protein